MTTKRTIVTAVALTTLLLALPGAVLGEKLEDAEVFMEINDTDGDAGIQMFLDGEGWRSMKVFDPDGSLVLNIRAKGSVRMQGLTELFFESAEPSFDEQPLDEFLGLFPRGRYTFVGVTTEGEEITGKARFTHVIPDAPVLVFPVDEEVDPEDAVFSWMEVPDPPGSEIVAYEVIVECEGEEEEHELFMTVGSDVDEVTIPEEFLAQEDLEDGAECKWEVLAIEDGGNKTISEAEFELG